MVQGRDRRLELGYQLALNCRNNLIYPLKNKNSKFNKIPPGGVPAQANGGVSDNSQAVKASA